MMMLMNGMMETEKTLMIFDEMLYEFVERIMNSGEVKNELKQRLKTETSSMTSLNRRN